MAGYSGDLIGEHPSIKEVRRLIQKVAESPTRTVLIYGPTGTGKGLVARMLHRLSPRAAHNFVDVSCAAIPGSLMESELFGYERGAFTGAQQKKTGLVEAANGGTIFLDEIREMELPLQAKLLSLLDTHSFRRVGAVHPLEVDVRFIAATNRILLSEVKAGRFREDLYYRLQVVAINIPPLAERGDDVLVLTDYFLRKFNARYDRRIRGMEPRVREIFRAYSWPGNVRELENLLERIFILEDDDTILVRHLPARILREVGEAPTQAMSAAAAAATLPCSEPTPAGAEDSADAPVPAPAPASAPGNGSILPDDGLDFHAATNRFHEGLIREAMRRAGGNQSDAARLLGLSRHALRHYMLKLGIR